MVDRSKLLFVNAASEHEESSSLDSLQYTSFKTASYELTDVLLGKIVNAINARAGVGDAAKFINTNANGYVDNSFIDGANLMTVDHGNLVGLGDDDHAQYILVNGTRAFTGNQSMGNFKLTSLATPTSALEAANKQYVDAVATGLRPKGNVKAASAIAENLNLASMPATVDGYALVAGDRFLAWQQTDATQNGIYVFNGAASAATRSADQDNDPLSEIVNGVFIPQVLFGSTNQYKPFFIYSVGTGTDGMHTIGTDNINWDIFTSPAQLIPGAGIDFVANVVSVDILANGGLKFVGGGQELAVEPADFAGEGLIDDGSDNLAIDWFVPGGSTSVSKAVKVSDMAANGAGQGANIIGVDPTNISQSAQTLLQGVLEDLSASISDAAEETVNVTVSTGNSVVAGDLLQFDGADLTKKLDITVSSKGIGLAKAAAAAGNAVKALQSGETAVGVLVGATAGIPYYWTGTALSTVAPVASGSRVWQVGYAKNATDLYIAIEFIKKNA